MWASARYPAGMTEAVMRACIQLRSDFAPEMSETIGVGRMSGKSAVSSCTRPRAQSGIENDAQVGEPEVKKYRRRNSAAVSTSASE